MTPLKRAAEASKLIRGLVDAGEIFHPLAWTPQETYEFLKEIPLLEFSGIMVRIPDWWHARGGRPLRPQVSVTVGKQKPAGLGLGSLLDFDLGLTLDGEELTEEEMRLIMSESSGLVLLRGKWVEVSGEKLAALLSFWKKRKEGEEGAGLSFSEGMRLLAGVGMEGKDAPAAADAREWLHVEAGEWLRPVLMGMRSPEGIAPADPGDVLKTTLRPYQQTGVTWLRFMHELGLGACLADDMGLGKTIQTLAFLLLLRRQREAGRALGPEGPALLVVPASLVANWKAELRRFAPSLAAFFAHPSETPAAALEAMTHPTSRQADLDRTDLVITTYAMLHRLEWLRDVPWGLVILDEAQAIKNPGARQTRAVKSLPGKRRIILSGTPLENRLGDLWSLFDFLCPGLLGSAKAFGSYVKALPEGQAHEDGAYGALRALVRPYILRRLKTDRRIIADLPDKVEVKTYCPLTKTQATLYEQSVRELAEKLKDADGIKRRGDGPCLPDALQADLQSPLPVAGGAGL